MIINEQKRREWSWTKLQKKRADEVLAVADDLREYWPVTLRQIFYQLVVREKIKNSRSDYTQLSCLIKWMRIDDMLPWAAVEDRTRRVSAKRGIEDVSDFIANETEYFLRGYTRCLVQGQANYPELWVEKDALSKIFEEVAWPYCIRSVVCKGYQSVTFIADYFKRAQEAINKGQKPIVLYFGDLDPSGVQMLEATQYTLEKELKLSGVEFRRCALNPEHVKAHALPHNPDALKFSDKRAAGYVKKFGKLAVELDAIHPKTLSEMAKKAVEEVLDMSFFQEQREIENLEKQNLSAIRADVMAFIQDRTARLTSQTYA